MTNCLSSILNTTSNLLNSKELSKRTDLSKWNESFLSCISVLSNSQGFTNFSDSCAGISNLIGKSRKIFTLPSCYQKGIKCFQAFKNVGGSFKNGIYDGLESVRQLGIKFFAFGANLSTGLEIFAKEGFIDLGKASTVILKPGVALKNYFGDYFSEDFWKPVEKISGLSKLLTSGLMTLNLVDDVQVLHHNPVRGVLKVATTCSVIALSLFGGVMPLGMAPALGLTVSTSLIYQEVTRDQDTFFNASFMSSQ